MLSSIRLRRSSRVLVLGVLAALLVVVPSGAQAAKPGNSQNAKACQKGGWRDLVRSDGRAFANQGNCVSYAAKGGQLQPKPLTPLQQCQRELAAAGLTAPPDANYILGTPGDDTFSLTAGNDVICGFAGNDSADEVSINDIFIGGDGNDFVYTMDGGTFNGGNGDDGVNMMLHGTFNGGDGNDRVVGEQSGGTFNGGDGNDRVAALYGGTFNGEAGCDSVDHMQFGTFNPGDQSTCSV